MDIVIVIIGLMSLVLVLKVAFLIRVRIMERHAKSNYETVDNFKLIQKYKEIKEKEH